MPSFPSLLSQSIMLVNEILKKTNGVDEIDVIKKKKDVQEAHRLNADDAEEILSSRPKLNKKKKTEVEKLFSNKTEILPKHSGRG